MKRNNVIIAGIFAVSFLVIGSCKKKQDTIAKVFIVDSQNQGVGACTVILKAVPTTNSTGKTVIAADTSITNVAGEAIFNFNDLYQLGQAGVAVLNIYASKDGVIGTGVIQLKEEETVETTVTIQ
jgi:hypothetical protein